MLPTNDPFSTVSLAFSKQAVHFDADDLANPILQAWRTQIYRHIETFLKPGHRILELNAGTGIDAIYLARKGYRVHATDLSAGMIQQLRKKIAIEPMPHLTCQQISFEKLNLLEEANFDYVFSNFGGLNCIQDLSLVTRYLSEKLNPAAYITWVVMPPVCPWEWLWFLKGKGKEAIRRFQRNGTTAHLEGETFQTYFHSHADIQNALGSSFIPVKSEGLGVLSAPPSATNFYKNFQGLYNILSKADKALSGHFPFNRWGDHIIATFQKIN